MNLLSINNLSKSYGAKTLFNKISFGINYGEKLALVAKNGSGKTTLFKILKGIEIADEGDAIFRKDITVGFLDQNFTFDESLSIQQLIDTADNKFVRCIKNYDEVIRLSETDSSDQLADRMEAALNEMNLMEAWDYEKNILEILTRLEIKDTTQIISTLSGGQKKRVALALTLINRPNLLVMDEPTNHLDIDMIEWLENYLQDSSLSILLVTHDRYFLDEVCDKIIEIDNHELYEYKGNFDYYLEKSRCDKLSFIKDYEILSLQRNIKIVGIFSRLSIRDGKEFYLTLLPRVLNFIEMRVSSNNPIFLQIANLLEKFI